MIIRQTLRSAGLLMGLSALLLAGCNAGNTPSYEGELTEVYQSSIYDGIGVEVLENYTNSFEVAFLPLDSSVADWNYSLQTIEVSNPKALQHNLSISSIDAERNPGDITLLVVGDTQYLTGPGVESFFEEVVSCAIAPIEYDLETSFLTPDSFIEEASDVRNAYLEESGKETIAGQEGTVYLIQADMIGNLQDVTGDLVVADAGGYVLRFTLTANTADYLFLDGEEGEISWNYEIESLESRLNAASPDECVPPYPVIANHSELTWLGSLVSYKADVSRQEAARFYDETMKANGWGLVSLPQEEGSTTLFTFAQEGVILNISISEESDGIKVVMVTES